MHTPPTQHVTFRLDYDLNTYDAKTSAHIENKTDIDVAYINVSNKRESKTRPSAQRPLKKRTVTAALFV